jgi:pimeloyl-ACP methyl ester carboxylesterase
MREMNQYRIQANGVGLQVYDFPGKGPAVLLVHATGFHGRCWDQVVERLPDQRCITIDMRGHGKSDKPAPPYTWSFFGADLAEVLRQLKLEGAIGVGHSMGGHSVVMAAAEVPQAFAALLLVDPVIMARNRYSIQHPGGEHFAARRRNHWPSPEAMIESFAKRPPFNTWDPLVLEDYCTYGLLPNPDGEGYVLACPPAVEAATYAGAAGTQPHDQVASIAVPVRVLRARQRSADEMADMSSSPTDPEVARHFRRGEDVFLPQHTHYIPMEAPRLVAGHILEIVRSLRSG